ncbi:MAG TPA: hypothetical protein VJB94_03945 [Candidatus Nanoarchaeia archaeon]|nr:hypothetical protein [Candidatus Nanoarchaeia archaeon]
MDIKTEIDLVERYQKEYMDALVQSWAYGIRVGAIAGALTLISLGGYLGVAYTSIARKSEATQPQHTFDIKCKQGDGKPLRKFIDYRPFGSLDEVVVAEEGVVNVLKQGDEGFEAYHKEWEKEIPLKYK